MNKYSATKSKSYQQLYFLIWGIYEFFSTILGSELGRKFDVANIDTTLRSVIIILLFMLFMFRRKMTKKFGGLCCLMGGLAVFVEISNFNKYFLIYLFFILNAYGLNFYRFICFDLKIKIITIFCILSMCITGIVDNYTAVFAGGVVKYAYGFRHPNTFTCFALAILIEWLMIRYKKMRGFEWICNLTIFGLVFKYGGGRSSSYAYLIIYFLFILAKREPGIYYNKISEFVFSIITPLMGALSFLGIYLYMYGYEFMRTVDNMLSGRFQAASTFLVKYGINLFGQDISMVSSRNSWDYSVSAQILDNAYAKCLLMYGLIVFLLIMLGYIFLLRQLIKTKHVELALCALFYVIIGIGESYMFDPLYNITLLCLVNVAGVIRSFRTNNLNEYDIKKSKI